MTHLFLMFGDPWETISFSVLQIIANDTGNPTDCCSTATVTIDLIDSNDHIPEFPQSTYNLSVMENSPDGTILSSNITVRHWAGSGSSLRPPGRAPGTPGTASAACLEGIGLPMHTGRSGHAGLGTLCPPGPHFWRAHCQQPVPQSHHCLGG